MAAGLHFNTLITYKARKPCKYRAFGLFCIYRRPWVRVDKECLISAFDSNHQFEGMIREVSDSAILVEKNGAVEAINLDFVIRIREYPKNKKGKKKSVVLD